MRAALVIGAVFVSVLAAGCSLGSDSDERRTAAIGSVVSAYETDIFLTVEGVVGGGEMQVLSYEWGGIETSSGKPAAQALIVTKPIDEGSPALFVAAAQGTQFQKAVLTVRRAGGTEPGEALLWYELVGVSVSSVNLRKATPYTEEVAFTYARLSEGVRSFTEAGAPSVSRSCFNWATKVSCSAADDSPRTPAVPGRFFPNDTQAALRVDGLMIPEELSSGLLESNVLSFSTTVQAPAGAAPPVRSFTFVKPIDSDSPAIYLAAAQGKPHARGTFSIRGLEGGELKTFLAANLTDVVITSVKASGSQGGHTETVSLRYQVFDLAVGRRRACFDFVAARVC